MIALIDADIVVCRVAFAHEQQIDFGGDDNKVVIAEDEQGAFLESVKMIEKIKKTTGADRAYLCFSDKRNFRKHINPSYKSNRIGKFKPGMIQSLKTYLGQRYPTIIKPWLEADDILGIMSERLTSEKTDFIICSTDKDMRQLKGLHYNWQHETFKSYTERERLESFYYQVLVGDSCDGYGGCPKVGDKKAQMHLNNVDIMDEYEVWSMIVSCYESMGQTEVDAMLNARMAWLLKDGYEPTAINLWSPFGDRETICLN